MSVWKDRMKACGRFFSAKTPTAYMVTAGLLVVCALLLELFVFNFKWIVSAGDTPLDLQLQVDGGTVGTDGSVTFTSDTATVTIDNVDAQCRFLHFRPGSQLGKQAEISVAATDEANDAFLSAPSRTVLSDVPQSQYIRLHYSGQVREMRITVSGLNGVTISRDDLTVNGKVPLMFSFSRFVVVALALMVLYILRPGSGFYRYRTDLTDARQKGIVVGLFVLEALLFWGMLHWNAPVLQWYQYYPHHQQYYKLTDSLKEGHFYLDQQVPQELKDLSNPYDYGARLQSGMDVVSCWDYAYYGEKLYVYFGIVPVLLLYLPYNLITGGNLPNHIAVYIFGLLLMAGVLYLLWQMIKKWFSSTPFVLYLLLSVVFAAAAAVGYSVYKPDFYLVPSIAAVAFCVWGLGFWLSAGKKDEGGTTLIPWRLAMGSLCIALTAGCRPQMLLGIGLGIILFWDNTFQRRNLFSKNSVRQTTAVCLPFAAVALGIMWYNFARFGSPFDFGASYNLTTNDMTHRGFVFGRMGLGIFSYLFQPVSVNGVFPFLHDFGAATAYQGLTLTEKMVGGVFWLFPVLLFGLYGVFHRRLSGEKKIYPMILYSVVAAFAIVVADTQMAGLLTRYFTDFVWLLLLAAVLTILALCENKKDAAPEQKKVLIAAASLGLVTLAFVFLRVFAHTEDSIQTGNPVLYYTVQHLIAFWM